MSDEAQKFDAGVRKILSVSHDEIVKRDKEWHRKRARKKQAKNTPQREGRINA